MIIVEWIKQTNIDLFKWINSTHSPFADTILIFISRVDVGISIVLGTLLLLTLAQKFNIKQSTFTMIFLGMIDAVCHHILKVAFAFSRPCYVLDAVRLPLASCGGIYSFPSNHAANSMFLYILIYKKLTTPFKAFGFLLVFLVGYSRIYLGFHDPLDILGGWVFAKCFAFIYNYTSKINISWLKSIR